jgi:hypothetical protein
MLLGAKIADGDGSDASLGFHLASSTAKEVGRSLDRMTAEDLEELSYGAEQASRSLPNMAEVLERERLGAMLIVQEVQDAYLSGSAAELQTSDRFGRTVTSGVKSLQRLKPEEAKAWFEGLREGVGSALDHEISQVDLPLSQRAEWSPESSSEGWASFVQHAVGRIKPLMDEYDRTLCRLRLLSIEAAVRVELIRTGAAPIDLSDMPSSISTDPFSGREFCYEASGAWHKLYSTGPDGRNDGGGRGPNGEEADFGLLSGAF